jgi:DNA-binding CsgD family transcriptional regulator
MLPSSSASAATGNALVIRTSGPHDAAVNPIVAAASAAVRRELADLTQRAHFDVQALAETPADLAVLLLASPRSWVVTGGALTMTRPFIQSARAAAAPVVAVLSGRSESEDRSTLDFGGLAVLRAPPHQETFRAAAMASRAGLSVWDHRIDSLGTALDSGVSPLSPRERRVLELTGTGLSTKAVGRRLGISPNTVKFHLRAAFEKLGVRSRAEALMAAIRRGELSV